MKVLSLFNGMNVCAMALEDAGVEVETQYISEIDKYANKASETLFPDAIQLGSVLDWRDWNIDWASINLVTGGFPCQAWSMAGKELGDKDERGMLFWTMLDIIKQVKHSNPNANFLIENVCMKKEFEEYITSHTEKALGEVHKVLINSALVSAQNRNRYYWTSFPVEQPEDKGILLKDIYDSSEVIDITARVLSKPEGRATHVNTWKNMRTLNEKAKCLTASGQNISNSSATNLDMKNGSYEMLTVLEAGRLQTLPDDITKTLISSLLSKTQLHKMIGNAWTMKVISHILKSLTQKEQGNE